MPLAFVVVALSNVALLLIPLAFLVAALVVGRWWFLAGPLVFWTALGTFLLLNDGWFGAGWGDGGVAWNVIVAVLTCLATLGGVAVRDLMRRAR